MGSTKSGSTRCKCRLIFHEHLLDLLGIATHEQLKEAHVHWIEEALERSGNYREDKWTSSIGVGSEEFVKKVKNDLGIRARERKVVGETDDFVLREPGAPYDSLFEPQNEDIGLDNGVYWNNFQKY